MTKKATKSNPPPGVLGIEIGVEPMNGYRAKRCMSCAGKSAANCLACNGHGFVMVLRPTHRCRRCGTIGAMTLFCQYCRGTGWFAAIPLRRPKTA
jgi:hypothetical protein